MSRDERDVVPYRPAHFPKQVSKSFDPKERRTKSEFLKECDINMIMARYRKTGILGDPARQAAARFGDFSQVPTYQEMQQKVLDAHEVFMALPASVRKEFDNDPGAFISSADTPEGRDLLVKLGLGAPKPVETPKAVSDPSPVDVSDSVPSKKVK